MLNRLSKSFLNNIFANTITYAIVIHIVALIIFSILRLIFFIYTDYDFTSDTNADFSIKIIAFIKGLWFDNVVACYILLLPLVMAWISGVLNYTSKWIWRILSGYFIIMYSIAFSITMGNIPYFSYFFKIINSSIFEWIETADVAINMMIEERSYVIFIIGGICVIALFAFITIRIAKYFYKKCSVSPKNKNSIYQVSSSLILGAALIGLCIFGIRGRMGYNPIKVSQAYYCSNPFLNQLGVNPVFNLLTSTLDDARKENRQLNLMPAYEAVENVQKFLGRKGIDEISPIARKINANDSSILFINNQKKKNIVIIFMESMSANLMESFGNKKHLTPFIDSIFNNSLSFSNIYSSGIHTNHGLYSTLYSFPVIMKRNAMKGSVIPKYSGLPTVLKENGYYNLFFMTHESQYDNMNAFLRTNGFDEIYAQENYPSEKIANSFGVQDDFLYSYAIPVLNKQAETESPFMAVLLSVSNHPPYIVPEYFKARSKEIQDQIVEYADWSVKQFFNAASKEPWFNNTVFILLGDHGKLVGSPECEVPQSYNHIPLMFYGKDIVPQNNVSFGNQIDIAPTLLGMLGIEYTQNNFGIDMIKEARPFTFYSADNQIVARDSSHLYIFEPSSNREFVYNIKDNSLIQGNSNDEEFKAMKEYLFSMFQATEDIVRKRMTIDKNDYR